MHPCDDSPADEPPPITPIISVAPQGRPTRKSFGPAPPLGLMHLMLLVAGTAIYLGLNVNHYRQQSRFWLLLLDLFGLLPIGAGLAGLAIFVSRRVRRVPWPIEPGEWLLAIFGIDTLCWVAAAHASEQRGGELGFVELGLIVSIVARVVPTLAPSLAPRWKLVFGLDALQNAWVLAATVLPPSGLRSVLELAYQYQVFKFWRLALLLVIAWCVGRDHTERVAHTWLHWAGLAVYLLVTILLLLVYVVPFEPLL